MPMPKPLSNKQVNLTINGKAIVAPASMSVIQALWYAGYPGIKGVGCLEGVCGSCRVMVRRADAVELTMALGCQLLIEDGMNVFFSVFETPSLHQYQLSEISSSWDVQTQFQRIFPAAQQCRHCHGCNIACPKDIDVEAAVDLAVKGHFRECGDLFIDCVMCDLCMTSCPEFIEPNHVGLFARRVTAYFDIRPSNLINRLELIRSGQMQVDIDDEEHES